MAIAIAGIASVTVIIVALVMSAAYITVKQSAPKTRHATQKEWDAFFKTAKHQGSNKQPTPKEVDRFLESNECCTRIINWVEADQQPSHGGFFLITEEISHSVSAVSTRWFDSEKKEWLNIGGRVIAWAELPGSYKRPAEK